MVQPSQPAFYNPSPVVKSEDLTMMFDKFMKTMVTALQQGQQFAPTILSSKSDQDYLRNACNRCREVGHYVINCERINRLIKEGKCQRSPEGRVILPGGAAILKNILGRWISDCIEEYHHQNPGQLTSGILSSNTNQSQLLYDLVNPTMTVSVDASSKIQAMLLGLSREERIQSLEQEIFALWKKQVFDGVEITRPVTFTHAREVLPPSIDMVPDVPPTISNIDREPSPPAIPVTQPVSSPIHPFTNIIEASYVPPSMQNVGALPEKTKSTDKGEKDVAYKTVTPSQNEKLAEEVYWRTMQIPFITLTTEELFALSPNYHQWVREAITPRRVVPGEDKAKVVVKYMLGDPQLPFSVNSSEWQAATSNNKKGQQNEAFV
jgi:hypothetical protein